MTKSRKLLQKSKNTLYNFLIVMNYYEMFILNFKFVLKKKIILQHLVKYDNLIN